MSTPASSKQTTPSTRDTSEKSGTGCLALTLLLLGMAAAVGIAIYVMILLGGGPTPG